MTGRSRFEAPVEYALIAAGFAVLFFFLPHALAGDDVSRYVDIDLLLHHGELSAGRYSLVMPLVSAPFLLLGEVVESPTWWAAHFNTIVVAAGSLVALRLLRSRVDPAVLRKTLLVLLFASLLTNRLRDYNAEVLTATLVALGIVVLVTGRSAVVAWAAIAVGVANTPAALGGLALVALAVAIRSRRLRHLLPVVAAAGLIVLESWIRRGGPFVTGYEDDSGVRTIMPYSGRPGFSYPFVLGALSLLVSFGRGLVFFTPGLLLWLSGRTRRLAAECGRAPLLMLLFVGGLVLVYAKWWAWYGGLAWGPRFFAFAALPASLALALRLARPSRLTAANAVTLLVLAVSGWVGVSGAIADPRALGVCAQNEFGLESFCWYVPEYSSLWRPLLDFPSLTARTAVVAVYCALVFAWLATPLVAALARARPSPGWARGWRF